MRRAVLLGAVVTALLGVASAAADVQPVPAGFTANARLSAAASYVAGKPVTDYCAATPRAFRASLTDLPAWADPTSVNAYSTIGADRSFLTTWVCSYLNRWLARKPVTRYHLAVSIETLVHEAELLSGVADESIADCKGLAMMPRVIAKFFPLRKRYTMHDVMGDAWSAHDEKPEQYLANCPQR